MITMGMLNIRWPSSYWRPDNRFSDSIIKGGTPPSVRHRGAPGFPMCPVPGYPLWWAYRRDEGGSGWGLSLIIEPDGGRRIIWDGAFVLAPQKPAGIVTEKR